jgi:phosphatidylinositol alpha-1,6-mannosyltransferase
MDILVSFDFLPRFGGAHSWMYEQYRRWPTPVRVVTTCPSPDPAEAKRERAFDAADHGSLTVARIVAPARDTKLHDPRYWAAIASELRAIASSTSEPVTGLHALRGFPEGIPALLYRRLLRRNVPLVTYAHGEEILVARTSRQLTTVARAVYRGSDLIIANSERTCRMVADLCPSARVVRISPGVDAAGFRVAADQAARYRRSWDWPDGTIVVATVARMEPRKNHAMVLRAVAELRRRGLSLAYYCAGDGEERRHLEELATALGLAPWVRFPGPVTDAEKRLAFAACDIHAMPSIQVGPMIEGFGIVFVEAAAAGVPSVAGSTGGQAEAVRDGETGLVVDGTSLAAVCGALERLAADPGLRGRMGAAGREWAAQNDWDLIARKAYAEIRRIDSRA